MKNTEIANQIDVIEMLTKSNDRLHSTYPTKARKVRSRIATAKLRLNFINHGNALNDDLTDYIAYRIEDGDKMVNEMAENDHVLVGMLELTEFGVTINEGGYNIGSFCVESLEDASPIFRELNACPECGGKGGCVDTLTNDPNSRMVATECSCDGKMFR